MKKIIIFLLLLCPVLVQAKKKFDRGIVKSVFVPKGQWFMGSTVSYSEQSADQYQFLVLANIDAKGYTFRLSLSEDTFLLIIWQREQVHLLPYLLQYRKRRH